MVYSTDYYNGKVVDSILASLNITGLDERHFTAKEVDPGNDIEVLGKVVQTVPFTKNFTYNTFFTPNSKGISYETILSNNATFNVTYYVNDLEDMSSVPIPLPDDDLDCQFIHQRPSRKNCSCDTEKEITKDSVKFSFVIKNWPFTPPGPGIVHRAVGLGLIVRAPVDIAYYIANHEKPEGRIPNYPTCYVADYNLLLSYDVRFRLSTVQNMIADRTTVKNVNTVSGGFEAFNLSDYENTGLATVPFWALLSEFEEIAEYDPDISFLFGGINGELPDEQGENVDGGSDSADTDLIVGLVVGLVGFVILATVVIVVILLFLAWKKKQLVQTQLDIIKRTLSD